MDLTCPGCKSPMETVNEADIKVDRCAHCGGVFLDKDELNVLATGMSGNIEYCSIDDKEAPSRNRTSKLATQPWIPCLSFREVMSTKCKPC